MPDGGVRGTEADAAAVLAALRFDAAGLMLAWMNAEAVRETVLGGRACYWSRSRQAPWRKGDTSGQVQHLRELRVDCDGDAVLLLVDQVGVACHTGRRSCFYRAPHGGVLAELTAPEADPAALYPAARQEPAASLP